jgi:uncharacterized DUF497 family protein
MGCIWNILKAAANSQKHGVSFEEAQSVFRDPLAVTVEDRAHSEQEPREIIIHLISARESIQQERKGYEHNTSF